MANHTLYAFYEPEAHRMASLGGVMNDLRGVIDYCNLLNEHQSFERLNFCEWEAISIAAVVRYARCFVEGKRDRLNETMLSDASIEMQQLHAFLMSLRHRHVAHSVNPFEDNYVTVQISDQIDSPDEIRASNLYPALTRIGTLGFNQPTGIKELANWLLDKIEQEIKIEQIKLLKHIQRYSLERLKRHGPPFARPVSPSDVDKTRKRP
jgi:hypothetical protein